MAVGYDLVVFVLCRTDMPMDIADPRISPTKVKVIATMADLTYKPPVTPARQFKPGDTVEVLDREHKVIGRQQVVMASGRICKTECGRIWGQDGWRIGDDDRKWPFPSIRHTR